MRAVQRTGAGRLAGYGILFDQRKNQLGRLRQQRVQAVGLLLSQPGLDLFRRQPETGIDEAHVATGTAVTDGLRLQHYGAVAILRRLQGSGAAAETATDDNQVRSRVVLERRRREGVRGLPPQIAIVHGRATPVAHQPKLMPCANGISVE